jgi:hypothetical protein
MLRIDRIDEQLAALSKPELEPVSSFRLSTHDSLVICAGFEERAIEFLKQAVRPQPCEGRVLIVNYVPVLPENRLAETRRMCESAGLPFEVINYDRENVSGFGDLLCAKLSSDLGRIYVDVSGMSRLLIVQILVALVNRSCGFERSSVLYAEASDYPPTEDEVKAEIERMGINPLHSVMLLSSGVFDVQVIPELASASYDGQQTRLVAFPSFNIDQLIALYNELQPSHCTIIHGVPPDPQNKWRTDAISTLNHLDSSGTEEVFYTSTLDYRKTLQCLLRIYAKDGTTERILVAPTGSKMQSVAVGLFRAFVRDIQIVYPAARDFTSPTNYTHGVKRLYHLPLDSFVLHKSP